MARVKKGLLDISGKVGDMVVTKEGRYGKYIRKAVRPGSKKEEYGLKAQYSRTPFLNRLAGEINGLLQDTAGNLKPGNFYARLLGLFRKEPLDNRLLLLHQLRGMELRTDLPFKALINPVITLSQTASTLKADLVINEPPRKQRIKTANCYSFEVSLFTWMKEEGEIEPQTVYSEWVLLNDAPPSFRFTFRIPKGAVHWLLALRIRLGYNEEPIESFAADAMQLYESGSFNKQEQNWFYSILADRIEMQVIKAKKEKNITRIKRNP